MGGTNAHVVLEQAPPTVHRERSPGLHLLILSARTDTALEKATQNLAQYLDAHPDADLASVAYTLQAGRHAFAYRRSLACADLEDATLMLKTRDPRRLITRVHEERATPVVFMFPGQGSQIVHMGAGLYRANPNFAAMLTNARKSCTPILASTSVRPCIPTTRTPAWPPAA